LIALISDGDDNITTHAANHVITVVQLNSPFGPTRATAIVGLAAVGTETVGIGVACVRPTCRLGLRTSTVFSRPY